MKRFFVFVFLCAGLAYGSAFKTTPTDVLQLNVVGGHVNFSAASPSATYPLVLPASQGAAAQILVNDGAGNLSWGTSFNGLTGDVTATAAAVTAISVGAVTDAKASLANKPAVALVAAANTALTGLQTIDGVTTAANTLVLLTAQSTPSQNGPWQAQSGAWTRPTWYPSGGTTQAFQFITALVRLGTVYQGSTWRQTAAAPITIDTTATTWVVTPLALSGSTLSGILGVSNGGTGDSSFTTNAVVVGASASALQIVTNNSSATNEFLTQSSSGAPAWATIKTADLPAGTGTVTSIAQTVPSFLAVAGSPVTAAGTLAISLATETANTVFSGPTSGGALAPTFRSLVAADIPLISLATGVSGILPTANGGTGVSSSAVFPTTGTVDTTAAANTLTNKTLTTPVLAAPTINSGATFNGATTGAVTVIAPASGSSWTLTFPSNAGVLGTYLSSNGSGATSWQSISNVSFNFPTTGAVYGGAVPAPTFTGIDNSIIGISAGAVLAAGTDNTLYGYSAGSAVTSGTHNTVVGSLGCGSLTTGSDTVCLGYNAGTKVTGSDGIFIGANTTATSGTGNIGIGYLTSMTAGVGAQTCIGYSCSTNNTGTALGYQSTGAVNGVGVGYLSNGGTQAVALGSNSSANATGAISLGYASSASTAGGIAIGEGSKSTFSFNLVFSAETAQTTVDTASNQIDFGNATNSLKDMYLGNGALAVASPVAVTVQPTPALGTNNAGVTHAVRGGASTGSAAGGSILFQTTPAGASGSALNAQTTAAVITSAGNVGIGTTAPTALLQINNGHIKSTQTVAPTAVVNSNAGTGATCTVSNATDVAGSVTLTTTGVLSSSGDECDVTFNLAYGVAPRCTTTPNSANAVLDSVVQGVYFTTTTAVLSINFANTDAVGRTYSWFYHCIETQ